MDLQEELVEAVRKREPISQTLRDEIIFAHTQLIRYIVNRIAVRLPSHIDLGDLFNTGVIGLIDAIDKYDPEKNVNFKTYAEFRIKGAILDALRALDWVPRSVRQKKRKLERAYREIEQRLGRPADEEEIADSLGMTIEKYHELLHQVGGVSLIHFEEIRKTKNNGEINGSLYDIIEDVKAPNPLLLLITEGTRAQVERAVKELPASEKTALSLYMYGELDQASIGLILGVTESRACQIIDKAFRRLEKRLKEK